MPAPAGATCGNGKVELNETCDDGNTVGGDGCADHCRREPVRFLSWDHVLLADGTIISTKTGQALPGQVSLSASEGALLKTNDGLRYLTGLLPLPSDVSVVTVGAGLSPCLLDEVGEIWCVGGALTSLGRPHFVPGPEITGGGQSLKRNKLRRAQGQVSGLAGNIDVGCVLLDGGTTTQCWGREAVSPGFYLSAKMLLGRGRTAKQLVAGSEHVCALARNGEVGCWGDLSYGQTGYMAEIVSVDRPELPSFMERRRRTPPAAFLKFDPPVKQLAASYVTSCALLENGKLWCWGDTDAFAFENPAEPTFQQRMESQQPDRTGGFMLKPLGGTRREVRL